MDEKYETSVFIDPSFFEMADAALQVLETKKDYNEKERKALLAVRACVTYFKIKFDRERQN